MERINLSPGEYSGTYKLIGEEISFDFVNTVSWRGTDKEHDWLDQPANFIAWAKAAGIIDTRQAKDLKAQPGDYAMKELQQIYTARADLYNVLTPLAFNKKPGEDSIKKLDAWIHKIIRYRHIDTKNYEWNWDEPGSFSEILAPVIWNAAHVLTDLDHSRISHCPTCNWIFYDKTRNRSRKWCDMDDCGSRNKSLRYYHRKRE